VGGGPPVRAGQKAATHFNLRATLAKGAPWRALLAWTKRRLAGQGLQRRRAQRSVAVAPMAGDTPIP